jgi:hypothetical protein
MAGLGPAIHALNSWMPGTSPGMTALGRFNLAHSSEGGGPPANPNFGFHASGCAIARTVLEFAGWVNK